jgi:hypothetical protein
LAAAAMFGQAGDSRYNVTWQSPSENSLGSMPLSGRHGAGANVWVQDGSIWIYLGHSGAYDEQGRLLKLGCVRLTPEGTRLGGAGFRQTLDLSSGAITIGQEGFEASLWFADETLVVETQSGKPEAMGVAYAAWRDKPLRQIHMDVWNTRGDFSADHIQTNGDGVVWFHRDADAQGNVDATAASQGIDVKGLGDVTAKRVFGGALAVRGGLSDRKTGPVQWQFWDGTMWGGRTVAGTKQLVAVRLGAAMGAEPSRWEEDARRMTDGKAVAAAKSAEAALWKEYWSRAHVVINPDAGEKDNGFLIGRNYQLFRYMLACNRGGDLPLLFNGGIFTVDDKPGTITGNNNDELATSDGGPSTPDFRRWINCHFMSQNQRWLGWPTLANGDVDLLWPSLRFYRDRAGAAAARARKNGAEGVVYTEPLDIWGLCCVGPLPNGLCGAEHLTYHFSMMLEHAWMALAAHDVLGIDLSKDLPWIIGTVRFYDSYYRAQHKARAGKELGDDGKLVIYPGCGLELAGGATDQIEAVCALRRITAALLSLPEVKADVRADLTRIASILPEMPMAERQGKMSLQPAKKWEREYNKWEPIEMYAAWPYRMVGVTKPETLQLARDTWDTVPQDRARLCKQDYSWMANLVNMASLAWPEEAEKRAVYKMANNTAPQARFPAFFGPGHDWLPDHNWGGSGTVGIQEMLMASNPYGDGKIYLLYAWPKEWAVEFRLHTTRNTVVAARVLGGKVVELNVTPPEREKDVVIDPRFH